MKQFLYPAVIFRFEDEYRVIFPDLAISTEGSSYEDAYMFAKDLLRVYFVYALKYDLEYPLPSTYEEMKRKSKKDEQIVLIDAIVGPKDLK